MTSNFARPTVVQRLVAGMGTKIIELTDLACRTRPFFGEFLVEQQVLDRFQLLRTLQMQDHLPGARLGHRVAVLGYVPPTTIEQLHRRFAESELEAMTTHSFLREQEIEIVEPLEPDEIEILDWA
jgi:hypothetical protein